MPQKSERTQRTIPTEITNVRREGSDGYSVRWVEVVETRANRRFVRKDKLAVEKKRKQLVERASLGAPQYDLGALPPNDGTSSWWKNTFSAISDLAIKAANDGRAEDQKKLLNLSKTIAALSAAALPHAQVENLEATIEKQNKFIAEIQRRNITENAAQLSAGEPINPGVRGPGGPEDPILRHGDPVSGARRGEPGPTN
jgi:hypothetical protein